MGTMSNQWDLSNAPITRNVLNGAKTVGTYAGKALGYGLNTGVSAVNGFTNILKDLTHSKTQQDLYNYNVGNDKFSINQQDLYNFAKQKGFEGTFTDFVKNKDDLEFWGSTYASHQGASNPGSWATEFQNTFDVGKTLSSTQDLLNLGTSGWGLYENVKSYKDRKALMKKEKELLEQQIEYNRENMQNMREERARLGTMRSNTQAQRSSTSNIRSF